MMSMSGAWFFVVASEAITVGDRTITLPGIGAYVALAIRERNLAAVGWVILAMVVVIGLYDQLMFRPLVAWADRFRFEQTGGGEPPRSWVRQLFRRARLTRALGQPLRSLFAQLSAAEDRHAAALGRRGVGSVAACRPGSGKPVVRRRGAWGGLRRLGGDPLRIGGSRSGRAADRREARLLHDDPDRRADRAGQSGLGTLVRDDRAAAAPGGMGAAFRPVHGGVPRQPTGPDRRRGDPSVPSEPQHLAQPPDGLGNAVVHRLQRDRGRHRIPQRFQGSGGQLPDPAAGCGGAR